MAKKRERASFTSNRIQVGSTGQNSPYMRKFLLLGEGIEYAMYGSDTLSLR